MSENLVEFKKLTAKKALELQAEIDELNKELNIQKDQLRDLAQGATLEIIVDGLGKVNISKPREGSESTSLIFIESKLPEDLKKKLIEKGICEIKTSKIAPAKASVSLKLNV